MAKVYISPSKQEANIGVGNYGTEEMRMNEIADVVCECLTASGVTWYRNNPSWSSSQIVADSNSKNVDLHVALHSNAGGGKGTEVLVNSLKSKAYEFAKLWYDIIAKMTPSNDRGIKVNPSIMELNKTKAPAALMEYAFHDDKEDAVFIISNIRNLGIGTAQAICKYLGVKFINPYEKKEEPKTDAIYRVQVGAFSNQDNANKVRERLNLLGYNAIVVASK